MSVWEDVRAYLRGKEKEGAYLSVGGRGSIYQELREGGSLSQCGRTWEHISGMKRRRELLSVWRDVGAYLRGEEKEGAYLIVGGRGSISQGRREGGSLSQCGRTWEHISGMETCSGSILQGWKGGGAYLRDVKKEGTYLWGWRGEGAYLWG
jgi:hypothetical protein